MNRTSSLTIVTIAALALGAGAQATDFVAGAGKAFGVPNVIAGFTASGAPTGMSVTAYGGGHWGVAVATGSVLWQPTVLTGPGPGPIYGPHVRAFLADSGQTIPGINYYAYGTLRFGVNVGTARLDIAGEADDILTGAGAGAVFGPHGRGWRYNGQRTVPLPAINFYAYDTLKWGVNIAGGDVEGDILAEILTAPGPGPSFSPTIRGFNFDGGPLRTIAKINFNAFQELTYGADVSIGDHDGEPAGEIVATRGAGPSMAAQFKGFNYDAVAITALRGFDLTPFPTHFGGHAGVGGLAPNYGHLTTGAGPDPTADSTVKTWSYTGSSLAPELSFEAFPAMCCGVNATGVR